MTDLTINITKICEIIKEKLPNQRYKVTAEVSQPKISQGHFYLTLKDDYSTIKAIIWKTKFEKLKNKLQDGDKIIVYGKLDYYAFTGTVSFVIDTIVENEGMGELQKKYELLKEEFRIKGYYDKQFKLTIPEYIKKILIITSENGAALQDFLFALRNNESKIHYDIIDVPVQGNDSPKIIANKLSEIKDNHDVIIITRGGGSYQDLFGFSDGELMETVFNFKKRLIPTLSAIGHQVDNPLLDLVADYSCPTPSLAAQFLVDTNKKFIKKFKEIKNDLKENILENIHEKQKQIITLNNKLKDEFNKIYDLKYKFQNIILTDINNHKQKLEYLLKSLDNPNIELYNLDSIKIKDSTELTKNNILIMRWNNQDFKIQIL
jgi:exodeoxyribonuclease VII large subunit